MIAGTAITVHTSLSVVQTSRTIRDNSTKWMEGDEAIPDGRPMVDHVAGIQPSDPLVQPYFDQRDQANSQSLLPQSTQESKNLTTYNAATNTNGQNPAHKLSLVTLPPAHDDVARSELSVIQQVRDT